MVEEGEARKISYPKKDEVYRIGSFGELKVVGEDKKGRIKCVCSCGKNATYQAGALLAGNISCCGHTIGGFGKKNALRVKTFGKLEVISADRSKRRGTVTCKCTCGEILEVKARSLFLKEVTSCLNCKDTRTESMKVADEMVASNYRKDMLKVVGVNKVRTTRLKAYVDCECDCGKVKSFDLRGLRELHYGSCGCSRPKIVGPNPSSEKAIDLKYFTYWEVLSWDSSDNGYVNCRCRCGTEKSIRSDSLLIGDTTSCGCRQRELTSARFKGKFTPDTVGRHPLYSIYQGMRQRCYSTSNLDYDHYGGRGISMSSEWLSPNKDTAGFFTFLKDMEGSYEQGLEIERIDVNGNYEKGNCTWVCRRSQVNNLRRNRTLSGFGIVLNVSEWGYLLHFNPKLLDDRINKLKWAGDLEGIITDAFRDRRHTLLYKGTACTATEIWVAEGFTEGQRNGRLNKHGDSIKALEAEGIDFEVMKPRGKEYLTFTEGLDLLRTKNRDRFEDHLLYKINEQLEENK